MQDFKGAGGYGLREIKGMLMNNIILIGFMGSGKSTVAIRLSYRLRRILQDTDKYIEKKEEKSISQIFEEEGEAAFRQMETDCLKKLLHTKEERIISAGGGLPIKKENQGLLKQLGTVIYLKISAIHVWERLKNDITRPLLQCENPLKRIEDLIAERAPIYEAAADIIIDVDEKDMEQVVAEIIKELMERGILEGGIRP